MRNDDLKQLQWMLSIANIILALTWIVWFYYQIQIYPKATLHPFWAPVGALWGFTISRGMVENINQEAWKNEMWYLQVAALFFTPVFVILRFSESAVLQTVASSY